MKKQSSIIVMMLLLSLQTYGQKPWDNGKLQVSDNKCYLQHENGNPFFWQGDTGWLLFQRVNREEAQMYFADRKSKGFNVVQCIILQFIRDTNAYGAKPFVGEDITRMDKTPGNNPSDPQQYDWWDHVDYMLDLAEEAGMYVAITPVWGQYVLRNEFTPEIAEKFAANIAKHFKNRPNVIWLNGGSAKGTEKDGVWDVIGKTIKKHDPNHLMTFHPFGRMQSSEIFPDASWMDFNMFTSGHRNYDQDDTAKGFGEDNWRYVKSDLLMTPLKPTIDGEPSYESTPQGLHDATMPYWNANDCRRYAYWSVFAGACGHVYGNNAVRQFYYRGEERPASGARFVWNEAINDMGSFQMRYLKDLMLSRPYFDRVNDQSLIDGDEGNRYERLLVTRGESYAMIYNYTGREFKVNLGKISGTYVNAWWYNPRNGETQLIGKYKNHGVQTFKTPGGKAEGNDWVLVLDDMSKNYGVPGKDVLN